MRMTDFRKVCQKMHDICWIIAESEDITERNRNRLLKIAEQFYRMKLYKRKEAKKG